MLHRIIDYTRNFDQIRIFIHTRAWVTKEYDMQYHEADC